MAFITRTFEIGPDRIDTTEEFGGEFGPEGGPTAKALILFCQNRGSGWEPLDALDFTKFCVANNHPAGLTGLSGLVQWHQAEHVISITEEFVRRAYTHHPKSA